jgi:NADH:ubiquinone oxidoreductase subunit 6 (subunit J)
MTLTFAILAVLTIAGAAAALTLRNLVHCVLALTLSFLGLAGFYLQLSAQFVGFAQVLVYVGAVAILVVFAVLLTRGADPTSQSIFLPSWVWSGAVAASVFGVLAWTISRSAVAGYKLPLQPAATVKQIGDALMSRYALPLEVIGLLLTVALIGAVTIAMREKQGVR